MYPSETTESHVFEMHGSNSRSIRALAEIRNVVNIKVRLMRMAALEHAFKVWIEYTHLQEIVHVERLPENPDHADLEGWLHIELLY